MSNKRSKKSTSRSLPIKVQGDLSKSANVLKGTEKNLILKSPDNETNDHLKKTMSKRRKSRGQAQQRSKLGQGSASKPSINANLGGGSTDLELKKKTQQEMLLRTIQFFEAEQKGKVASQEKPKSATAAKRTTMKKTEQVRKKIKSEDRKKPKSKQKSQAVKISAGHTKKTPDNQVAGSPKPTQVEQKQGTEPGATPSSSGVLTNFNEKQMMELFKNFLQNFQSQSNTKQAIMEPSQLKYQPASSVSMPRGEPISTSTALAGILVDPTQLMVEDAEKLENLHDDLCDLFASIQTIRDSYHDIVKSLVTLQRKPRRNRRESHQPHLIPSNVEDMTKGSVQGVPIGLAPPVIPANPINHTIRNQTIEQILERFTNSVTRKQAFDEVFERIEHLRAQTREFCSMFTTAGVLMPELYQGDRRITQHQFDLWREEIDDMNKVADILLQEYNKEVLELFRLSQTSSCSLVKK